MENFDLTVFVPKGALTDQDKSRNGIADLLYKAGYDEVRQGFNRQDFFEQGGIRFLGIKDAPTLKNQFESTDKSAGIIMGSDVLVEACLSSMRRGVTVDVKRILDLDIGKCRFRILAPTEDPVLSPTNLAGRVIYTKYPETLRRVLNALQQQASILMVTGAEIRANEQRKTQRTAAFEIVESGSSARENDLQIADGLMYPSSAEIGAAYAPYPDVATDLYGLNINRLSDRTRDALMAFGLALESVLKRNEHVLFRFNVQTSLLDNFAGFGMRGPTVSRVMSRDGLDWSAVEICLPKNAENATRLQLIRMGAKDIVCQSGLQTEPDSNISQVLRFFSKQRVEPIVPERAENLLFAEFLLSLDRELYERATSGDSRSSTVRALTAGTEFCASKCGEEVMELFEALNAPDRQKGVEEAADVLYRFLVALRSRDLSLSALVRVEVDNDETESEEPDYPALLEKFLRNSILSNSGALSPDALIASWNACSTALRKSPDRDVQTRPAVQFLRTYLSLLDTSGIRLDQVMTVLDSRRRPTQATE